MKILYAVQTTGNGHLSRALDIVPALKAYGSVDVLLSGTQADLSLPFPVRYQQTGLSFTFGTKGGVDLWDTYKQAGMRRF